MKLIDITDHRFGRLVVIRKRPDIKSSGGSMWECRCDCGNVTIANSSNIRSGDTTSCGCRASEWSAQMGSNQAFIAKRAKAVTKHGHKRRNAVSPEYKTWLGMKRRCADTKYHDYKTWGGRGIRVCSAWDGSFVQFLTDMGPKPSPLHSIDRINCNGNYEPSNCRWATPEQQGGENRRGLISVTIDGASYPSLKAACRATGVPYTTAYQRTMAGHSVEDAATISVGHLPNKRPKESYLPRNKR